MKPLMRVVMAGTCVVLLGCGQVTERKRSSQTDGEHAIDVARWLAAHPLPVNQASSIVEVGKTDSSSLHIVQLRDHESLHVHQHHDMVLVMERGSGTLRLGAQTFVLKPGEVVPIPRNAPHAFANRSHQPAAALIIFSPPYDETDSVVVPTTAQ